MTLCFPLRLRFDFGTPTLVLKNNAKRLFMAVQRKGKGLNEGL